MGLSRDELSVGGPEPRLTALPNVKQCAGVKVIVEGVNERRRLIPPSAKLSRSSGIIRKEDDGKIIREGIWKRIPGGAGENHRGHGKPIRGQITKGSLSQGAKSCRLSWSEKSLKLRRPG
jgi:hypothetical protein